MDCKKKINIHLVMLCTSKHLKDDQWKQLKAANNYHFFCFLRLVNLQKLKLFSTSTQMPGCSNPQCLQDIYITGFNQC